MKADDAWWLNWPEPGPWVPTAHYQKPPVWEGERAWGWFGTFDCMGCGTTTPTNCPAARLCQDCRADLYNLIARAIGVTP